MGEMPVIPKVMAVRVPIIVVVTHRGHPFGLTGVTDALGGDNTLD